MLFSVRERRRTSRHEQVQSLTGEKLQNYLRKRLLDAATVEKLQAVLHLLRQAEEAQRQIKQIDRQREAIYKQQTQIQGNLKPLGREGDEGALRARYVAELNTLEDTLKALQAQEAQLHQQIADLEAQAAEMLAKDGNA
ncbi:MAG: hypothetical protein HC876_03795 [Chloroflexaceae bacterium]|nr:hypothetical protein [Chloroflexaceae bacterium]